MDENFRRLRQTWEELGEKDPLWAVVSHEDKRGGKWDINDFLKTGETDVSWFHRVLQKHADAPTKFQHVLDFGCGVGRLCLAWSQRSIQVTGVDISAPMLQKAENIARNTPNLHFQLNKQEDLSCFEDHQFDLVASHICLQHMPWEIASKYVREFGRVCCKDGWVAFQLPSKARRQPMRALRKSLVESLPFGLGAHYRKWRHDVGVAIEMYYTSPDAVDKVATDAGLRLVHQELDPTCGAGEEGFLYVFRKLS